MRKLGLPAGIVLAAMLPAGVACGQPVIAIPDLWIELAVAPATAVLARPSDPAGRLTYTMTVGNSGDPATLQGVELRFYPYDQQSVYSFDGGGDFACRRVEKPYPSQGEWYIRCVSGNFPMRAVIRIVTLPVLPGPIASAAWIDPDGAVVERTRSNNAASALAFAVP